MFDIEVTHEVADAIAEIGRKPKTLTREACTTPELRLEYIAQWLEAGGEACDGAPKFDIRYFTCHTTCCIAGKAVCSFGSNRVYASPEEAQGLLGLRTLDRYSMFSPDIRQEYTITPAWAARCIRHYQKTGVVDWGGTR